MSILNEISQVFAVSQSSDQLFQAIHAQVNRLFDTRNFYLATYDGSAEWTSAYHIEHGARQPKARYQLGSGFTSHILRTGRPILIHNEAESKAFHTQHGLTFVGDLAKSWMGVPLLVSVQPTGVMGIQSYEQENLYHEHDLILFSTIAAQAAIALQNTRLYEEARIRAEELAAMKRKNASPLRVVISIPSHAVFDIVIDDEVQLLIRKTVVSGKHEVDFVNDGFWVFWITFITHYHVYCLIKCSLHFCEIPDYVQFL